MTWKALVCTTALLLTAPAMAMADSAHFNIAAQALPAALKAFAEQAKMQLLYQPGAVDRANASAVVGELDKHAALEQLLRGTGLEAIYSTENAATIRPIRTPPTAEVSSSTGGKPTPSADDNADYIAGQDPKSTFWKRLRLAQTNQGTAAEPASVKKQKNLASEKDDQLQEVVVTGSRLVRTAKDGPQEVNIYSREQIEQSGQTTVADFLNTIPAASVASTESASQTFQGGTTVQLHGLPAGTTLVLINGRRVEAQASTVEGGQVFFDLNNIPLSAVERVEVVPEGSSAVYGSDAIAGVVNIVLKKNLTGVEVSSKYGWASGTHEWDASLAWGAQGERGSVSVIGSFLTRSDLSGFDRSLTANNDYTRYGGPDSRFASCHPGNIFSVDGSNLPGLNAPFAAVPAGYTGKPTQQEFANTAGTLNKCSLQAYLSYIPSTRRAGVLGQGNFNLTSAVQMFAEVMYSHVLLTVESSPASLFGQPGFQQFTASASNPYNPFGETVGVADLLTSLGDASQPLTTDFFRPLVGVRGSFLGAWTWEVTGWLSQDRSRFSTTNFPNSTAIQAALNSTIPGTALNPFVAGPEGSPELLKSLVEEQLITFYGQKVTTNGFVRGPVLTLPSGPMQVVIGGEYDRDTLDFNAINYFLPPNTKFNSHRNYHAVFGEARVPILANSHEPQSDALISVTMAGRYDSYSDFGSKTTPQLGIEWRPFSRFLIRGTYGRSFKAPGLFDLNDPTTKFSGFVFDPLNGNQAEAITAIGGGNPHLRPETGRSHTFGFVYSSSASSGLQLSVTSWVINESNNVQAFGTQTLVDNANLFPGAIVRASKCPKGPPCPITEIQDTFLNFGEINVSGIDYQVTYKYPTTLGEWTPSLSATEVYHYSEALTPGAAAINASGVAQDSGNWAPRWKGTLGLGWNRGPYVALIGGRYVSRYQDYDRTREIGKFWIYDANFRFAAGQAFAPDHGWLKGGYIEVGGINVLNTLPQFSNFGGGFFGYDPAQGDIRGRFLYAQLGVKW